MRVLLLMVMLIIASFSYQKTHVVSWYDLHGRPMANGKIFKRTGMTCAASRTYKLGEVLEVKAVKTMKKVVVTVTDRGDFAKKGITLDLSPRAFKQLFPLGQGLGKVHIRKLD